MSGKRYETGSGNVFQDIGVPNPEEHLVKAQLVFRIDGIIKERRLKQIGVADLLGIRQPDVSKMLRGEFRQFSVERLLRFLVALNKEGMALMRPCRRPKRSQAGLSFPILRGCGLIGAATLWRAAHPTNRA
jgi:predicted XRE-type DNA-binding protein